MVVDAKLCHVASINDVRELCIFKISYTAFAFLCPYLGSREKE